MAKNDYRIKQRALGFTAVFFFCLLGLAANQLQVFVPEVPFVPTPHEVVAEILRVAGVGENDVLYDLGCGDGRIVITAAKEFGCRGVGIDIDPERIRESRENAHKEGVVDRVEFYQMDLFNADISQATVVTLYLLSRVNLRLRPKLLSDLKPGTRVVSHDFDMEDWAADETSFVEDEWDTHKVFFWVIPASVTGTWKWTIPGLAGKSLFNLKLEQTFQSLRGEAFENSEPIPVFIKDGKIKGTHIEFVLERKIEGIKERLVFQGSMSGRKIAGSARLEGSPEESAIFWNARRIRR